MKWGRVLRELTKARLVSLVVVTAGVGYLMAGGAAGLGLLWTLLGTALTAAGSMAFNELIERDRDARMARTRHRPIPAGEVSPRFALVTGAVGVVAGLAVLAVGANALTALLGLVVVVVYVAVYTPLKARSTLCTLVGAVCGAIPPMMGWAAVTGTLGFGAWLLAGVLFLWQIPHFLALAWLYREDYARGGFRVLPVVDPDGHATSAATNLYITALLPLGAVGALGGLVGPLAAAGSALLGLALLALGLQLARARTAAHARRLFLATLIYLPLLLGLMVADRQAPAQAIASRSVLAPSSPQPL